jgi:hypothetical protein
MPKLLNDTPDFFEIQRDDGSTMNIAKKGLTPAKIEYFQGMSGTDKPSSINRDAVAAQSQENYNMGGDIYSKNKLPPIPNAVDPIIQDQVATQEAAPTELVNRVNFEIDEQREPSRIDSSTPMDRYKSSSRETANLQADAASDSAILLGDLSSQNQALTNQFKEREEQLKLKEAQAQKDYEDVSREYFESEEIDQDRYWSDMSTGRKIAAGIGLVFASLNPQAMQTALGAINRAVDRDIQAQKIELGKRKEKMGEAKSLVGKFYQKYKDLDSAELAAKGVAIESIKLKLQAQAEKTKSSVIRSKNETAIAQIEMEQQKVQSKLKNKLVDIGGYTGTLDSPTEAKGFREAMNNLQTAETSINRLLEINKKTGKSLSPNLNAEAEVLQKSLIGLLRVPLTGPGAMNASEQALLERLVANPTDIFSLDSNTEIKLKTLLKTIKNKASNEAKNLGLTSNEQRLGFKKS